MIKGTVYKKINIFLFTIFFLIYSNILKAADFSSADQDYRTQYNLGTYNLIDSEKTDLNFKRYQDVSDKYMKPGAIIYCIVKGGPADLAGLKIFDRIVGIDDHPNFSFLFQNNNPINVKYIRDDILNEIVIQPEKVSNLDFNNKLNCSKEFAQFECLKNFRSKALREKKIEWVKTYECLESKGSKIIPFEKNVKNAWLMLDSFDFAFAYYIWENQNTDKLKYYISRSKEIILELEKFLKEDNPGSIDRKIVNEKINNLINNISNVNTYVTDDRLKNALNLDSDKFGVNRIKKNILQINNFNDKENLQYFKTNYLVLQNAGEKSFINKQWKRAVEKINWNERENFKHVKIYIDYIDSLDDEKSLLAIDLLNDLEKKIIKYKNDKNAILALRQIYSLTWSKTTTYFVKTSNNKAYKILENLVYKFEKNYLEFQKLDQNNQLQILKDDSLFLTAGYSAISSISSQLKNIDKAIEYADLRIQIFNSDNQYSEEDKLFVYYDKFSYLALGGYTREALNSYYTFKNSAAKVYKTRNGLINLSITIPSMVMYLYQLGLYEEAQELVNIANKHLTLDSSSKNEWYDRSMRDTLRLYEALLYKKKFEYKKSISLLENLYDKCQINSYDATIANNCSAFAHLLELYYKTSNLEKFESTYSQIMGEKLINENYKNIYNYAITYSPDQITGLFKEILDYYKNSNKPDNYNKLANLSLKLVKNILSKENSLKESQHLLSYLDVYEGLAQLGYYLLANKHPNGQKILEILNNKIIESYTGDTFNSPVSTNTKAKNIISSYLNAAVLSSDDKFRENSYKLYQILRNSVTSKDIKKSLVKKSITNSKKYELVKKYQEYELLLASYYQQDDFKLSKKQNSSQSNIFQKTKKNNKIKSEIIVSELQKLKEQIDKFFPEYNNLIKFESLGVKDIQKKLKNSDAVLDYYFDNENVYVFIITKDNFYIKKNAFSYQDQLNFQKSIRESLTVNSSGRLNKFNIEKSFQLYLSVFKFVEENLTNKKKIFVVPDGLLQNIPLNILAYENKNNCFDCSEIKWLMLRYDFSYLPSVNFINFKNKNNQISKNSTKKYLGIGDPSLEKLSINNNNFSITQLAQILNRGSSSFVANTNEIRKIYTKVEGSSEEILTVSQHFNKSDISILLDVNATETKLKNLDLRKFQIIHFATHGETSGAVKGYNEPFLVLTPPEKGTEEDDGLLTMTEIMQLENNANIVILSACNTASGNQKNSEGFSGLARAFLFSGSKSVMVSNWYVETFSAKELIINFMSELIKNRNDTVSSLKNTMLKFIKSNPDKSHPFYWAPFVIVGAV